MNPEKDTGKDYAAMFRKYLLTLSIEKRNAFAYRLSKEFETSVTAVLNMQYGQGRLNKMKREKINMVVGRDIFETDK
jgi:hypothetical protein